MPVRNGVLRWGFFIGMGIIGSMLWMVLPLRLHSERTSDACTDGRIAHASTRVTADNPVMWSRTYGRREAWEDAYRALSLPDGTYIVLGRKDSAGMYNAGWLLRLDATGQILWQETFSYLGFSATPFIRSIAEGVLIGTSFDIFKLLLDGSVDWRVMVQAGSGCDALYINGVGLFSRPNGWLYVGSGRAWYYYRGYLSHISPDFMLQKVWEEKEPTDYRVAVPDVQGGILIGGVRFIPANDDTDATELPQGLLVQIDAQGAPVARTGVEAPDVGFEIMDIAVLDNGDRIILGQTQSPSRVIIVRMTPTGRFLWQKTFYGIHLAQEANMAITLDGEVFIAGTVHSGGDSDIVGIFLDPKGRVLWARRYPHTGTEYAYGVATTQDGGFMILGSAQAGETRDLLVLKTDALGRMGTCSRPYSVEYSEEFNLVYKVLPNDFYYYDNPLDVYVLTGLTPPQRSASRSRPFCVVLQPQIDVQPETVDFGIVRAGMRAERVITVRNSGQVTVRLRERTSPEVPFTIVQDTCAPYPRTLRPRASCTVTVRFAPRREGAYRGHFTWTARAGDIDTFASVSLRGIAVPVLRIRP